MFGEKTIELPSIAAKHLRPQAGGNSAFRIERTKRLHKDATLELSPILSCCHQDCVRKRHNHSTVGLPGDHLINLYNRHVAELLSSRAERPLSLLVYPLASLCEIVLQAIVKSKRPVVGGAGFTLGQLVRPPVETGVWHGKPAEARLPGGASTGRAVRFNYQEGRRRG
jgi:hypothetical protein